ncbi:CST complex subunit CTC1 [Tripterygium wilfordii]|uniref:CST complex subunit CTC1 n=2 Tax=Tripterygium wilfordii TaxID=458696 RepID=A0A7J7D316_TRIWF|nr:CST complex subunit CTC1-like isoform X2 [Tripterygium wilfordii]KAF5740713.1 CST complex subunit CTC1 [Tripterygium wilfordii]
MDSVEIIKISDLLRRGRPLTAASSLPSSSSSSLPISSSSHHPPTQSSASPNPNFKILSPLNHPALLIGTVTLPTLTLKSLTNNSFQFSDDSSAICCDILCFDTRILGKKIHVLAWNFIPLKHSGGFLEIIRWCFLNSSVPPALSRCSNVDSIPLALPSVSSNEDASKARYQVLGTLESISPISVIPCSTTAGNSHVPQNLPGFLLRVMACQCRLCSCKEPSTALDNVIRGRDLHSLSKPLFVYFLGSVSCWHPAITKLIGDTVLFSGLKKKLITIGKEDSLLMYVTTGNSVLHLPRLSKKWLLLPRTAMKGKGESGTYTGVVKGVHMQGLVIELDKDVWLLLTDQLLTPPHSLRVGAVISARNVHFVNPKFSWVKVLILGACFKTSITIESFSPLESGCHAVLRSQSQLGRFIESLTFSARLWALLVVSCFRKKFAGILSEKEILGSKHKEGMAQMYARSHLPQSAFQVRHGVFKELTKHDSCGCGCANEPYCANLKLVAPTTVFLHWCEAMWTKTLLQSRNNCHALCDEEGFNLLTCDRRSYRQSLRKTFRSNDVGIVLVGRLMISPSSGRLQLVDQTGGIDAIVPDLPSTWNANNIYEVIDYIITVDGIPEMVNHLDLLYNESFSCRNIFHCIPLARERNLTICVCFHLGNATCRDLLLHPSKGLVDECKELHTGRFHLIWVTHKFPELQKLCGDSNISNRSSMFLEAFILPWYLFIAGEDVTTRPAKVSRDCAGENCKQCVPSKRCKIEGTSSKVLISCLRDDIRDADVKLSAYSSCREHSEGRKYMNSKSIHEIPCVATVRAVNNQSMVYSGILYSKKADGDCKATAKKVMLELESDNFSVYQLLQIGCYYITKHCLEDPFCNVEDYGNVNIAKVSISSKVGLWSLSLTSDEDLACKSSSNDSSPKDSSFSNLEVRQGSNNKIPKIYSDVTLHLSAREISLLEINLENSEDAVIKSAVRPDSSCLFPEGNIISVHGLVIGIHGLESRSGSAHLRCGSTCDVPQSKFFQGVTSCFCIHILAGHQTVRILGSLRKEAFPVGFGLGVSATFHRVLESGRSTTLMLLPVSLIVIKSIREKNRLNSDKAFNLESASERHAVSSPHISSGLVSELIQSMDQRPMQFHCRVAAVHFLIMEHKSKKYDDLRSNSRPCLVDIPLAGLVLDEGSFSCCCWANAEIASKLLRLHEELPDAAFENAGLMVKWVGMGNNSWRTPMYHLERILKKHDRITVLNCSSMIDTSHQDVSVSVGSDNVISSSDENLLKYIVLNACCGTSWTVAASMMGLNAVQKLEKEHFCDLEKAIYPMQNIWAREVFYSDPLTEARIMIKELLN